MSNASVAWCKLVYRLVQQLLGWPNGERNMGRSLLLATLGVEWVQKGFGCVWDRSKVGLRLVEAWFRVDCALVSVWAWFRAGFGLVLGCFAWCRMEIGWIYGGAGSRMGRRLV